MFYAAYYFLSSSCYDVDSWNGKARHSSKRTKSADMGCRFVCMSLSHTERCPTEIVNMFETEHRPPNPDGWIFFHCCYLQNSVMFINLLLGLEAKMDRQCRKLQYSGHFYLKKTQTNNESNRSVVQLTSLVYWSQSWKRASGRLYFFHTWDGKLQHTPKCNTDELVNFSVAFRPVPRSTSL